MIAWFKARWVWIVVAAALIGVALRGIARGLSEAKAEGRAQGAAESSQMAFDEAKRVQALEEQQADFEARAAKQAAADEANGAAVVIETPEHALDDLADFRRRQ